jgi:hypothetical protein
LPEDALIDAAAEKQKAVADALQKAFQAFAQDFRRDTGHRGGVRLSDWTTFCRVGRFIPQGRGMPPALIELGKQQLAGAVPKEPGDEDWVLPGGEMQ